MRKMKKKGGRESKKSIYHSFFPLTNINIKHHNAYTGEVLLEVVAIPSCLTCCLPRCIETSRRL